MTPAQNTLDSVLDEIEDYLFQHQDIRDGDGRPLPNEAMSLLADLRWWRSCAKRSEKRTFGTCRQCGYAIALPNAAPQGRND